MALIIIRNSESLNTSLITKKAEETVILRLAYSTTSEWKKKVVPIKTVEFKHEEHSSSL